MTGPPKCERNKSRASNRRHSTFSRAHNPTRHKQTTLIRRKEVVNCPNFLWRSPLVVRKHWFLAIEEKKRGHRVPAWHVTVGCQCQVSRGPPQAEMPLHTLFCLGKQVTIHDRRSELLDHAAR